MGEDLDVREVLGSDPAGGLGRCPADGLDTIIGEGGRPVSVGQARRIALARALLRRSRVLLLDEPTAGVDPESEAAILAVLRTVPATVIVVGHRSAIDAIADHTFSVGWSCDPARPAVRRLREIYRPATGRLW